MKRLQNLAFAIMGAGLSWLVAWGILGIFFDPQTSLFFANVLLAFKVLHEIGHLIILEANGIRGDLILAPFVGMVKPYKEDREKLKQLNPSLKVAIYLAGAGGTGLAAAGSALLCLLGVLDGIQLLRIVNLSGFAIILNLLPVRTPLLKRLDGKRFTDVLFENISREKGTYISQLIQKPICFWVLAYLALLIYGIVAIAATRLWFL